MKLFKSGCEGRDGRLLDVPGPPVGEGLAALRPGEDGGELGLQAGPGRAACRAPLHLQQVTSSELVL